MIDSSIPIIEPSEDDLLETPRLTDAQRRYLVHFSETPLSRRFYLSGGAALAAGYLGHRYSDDLDFFTPGKFPIRKLVEFMEKLPGLKSLQWLLPRDRTTFLITWDDGSQVKVEYRQFPFTLITPPWRIGSFLVDSFSDLLANKLYALVERRYELDRIDIYLILRELDEVTLKTAVDAAESKFGLDGLIRTSVMSRLKANPPETAPECLFEPLDMSAMMAMFASRS
jgi:hypothetical protein